MTHEPRVSVLIVTYNHEQYLERAVASVLEQETDFEFEIVIGEDCSPDRTREIALRLREQHPHRIRLLTREANVGAAVNFRETYAACAGEFVAILEGDDCWCDSRKLQKQVSALDEHPHWSLCFHRVAYVDSHGVETGTVFPLNAKAESGIADLIEANFIQTCSILLRRSTIPRIPDWFAEVKIGDWPLCILAAHVGAIGFLPDVMAHYRVHPGGMWSKRDECHSMQTSLTMLAAVDRHFQGRYAGEVAKTRDGAIRWLFDSLSQLRATHADLRTSYEKLLPCSRLLLDVGNGFGDPLVCELPIGDPGERFELFELNFDVGEQVVVNAVRWQPVVMRSCRVALDRLCWDNGAGRVEHVVVEQLSTRSGLGTAPGAFQFDTLFPTIEVPIRGKVRTVSIQGTWSIDGIKATARQVQRQFHQHALSIDRPADVPTAAVATRDPGAGREAPPRGFDGRSLSLHPAPTPDDTHRPRILILSGNVNFFYNSIARRIGDALQHLGATVDLATLVTASARDYDACLVINLAETIDGHTVDGRPAAHLAVQRLLEIETRSRLFVVWNMECAGTKWFARARELLTLIRYDMLVDAGLHDQLELLDRDVPRNYTFLTYGPTDAEIGRVRDWMASDGNRPIPWATIGHFTPQRAEIVERLVTGFDPAGFVYLPPLAPMKEGGPHLDDDDLQRLFERTRFHVWRSHHDSFYMESDRVRMSALAGTVPIKVCDVPRPSLHRIPFDRFVIAPDDLVPRLQLMDFKTAQAEFIEEFCGLPSLEAELGRLLPSVLPAAAARAPQESQLRRAA